MTIRLSAIVTDDSKKAVIIWNFWKLHTTNTT